MAYSLQPKKIVLKTCGKGKISDRKAHLMLNRLSKEMHEAVMDYCSLFEKSNIIPILYHLFDESCFNFLQHEHFATDDINTIYKVETMPTLLRYLLEVTILCPETQQHQITKRNIVSLLLGAKTFVEACEYSNYLYRNGFAGGFSINKRGDISYYKNEKVRKSELNFVDKMSLLSEKMKPDETKLELDKSGNVKPVSLIEDAEPYDPLFRKTYGINLSTVIGVAEAIIFRINKKRYGVEIFSQNALLKKIKRFTNYNKSEIKKALKYLGINKTMLSKEFQYYRHRDAPVSVSRRPLIRLFEGSGKKGDIVYFGPNALIRAIALLFADIDRGVIKIGDVAERWAQEKGYEFEKTIKLTLSNRGFKVIRVKDTPAKVGEIDAIAFHAQKHILLIVEAKAPTLDISMDKMKWHYERARKWCEKHDKKVKWVKMNVQKLLSRLNLPHMKIEKIMGVIVTKIPWYIEPDLPYMILSFEEFERLLNRISNT